MTEPLPDPYDPSDDEELPAPVEDVDDTEPVELEEASADEALSPPEEWAQDLTDEDVAERLVGVEITEDPEDGAEH